MPVFWMRQQKERSHVHVAVGVARKRTLMLKATNATRSPVTDNGDSRQIAEKLLVQL
jgi:hypothetical protein